MASHVSLQVCSIRRKKSIFAIPDSFWLVRNVSQECFEVGDASGVTMSQRPYNHGFLSMSSFCTRMLFMDGHAFLWRPSWLSNVSSFFLFGGQSVGILLFFVLVPTCSDHVPNRFSKGSPAVPNTFPIAPEVYRIRFVQSSTFMVYKLKRWACL